MAMKKNSQILRQKLSLGDLVLAVSSCTKSTRETVAAVADLLGEKGKDPAIADRAARAARTCLSSPRINEAGVSAARDR